MIGSRYTTRRGALVGLATTAFAGGIAGAHSRSGGEYESTDVLDLFVGAGQSNASGRGDDAESPTPDDDTAFEFDGDDLDETEDPVGGHWDETEAADTGSMWPAFCDEYGERTGRHTALVVVARGATAQCAAADEGVGHWDVDGEFRDQTMEAVDDVRDYLDDHDYAVNLGGIVWCQGEQDASGIETGEITKATYEDTFRGMISYFRTQIDRSLPFHVVQTGHEAGGDTDGYRAVRDAQADVARTVSGVTLASTLAKTFPERGEMSDRYHYTQDGYNELGRDVAKTTAETLLAEY